MRQPILPPQTKEYILDVTHSFAYEVHRQPKKIVRHAKSRQEMKVLSEKLEMALRKLLATMEIIK